MDRKVFLVFSRIGVLTAYFELLYPDPTRASKTCLHPNLMIRVHYRGECNL